ncbi:hypothetical protein ACSBM8_05425 [Sphingomonas sp. ASY06-1R]|uniref:hypothetical protein n=1 Tax=Sphingomonas sp. ASY06-1R TaxID=3445771 RepID=UPI003FA28273
MTKTGSDPYRYVRERYAASDNAASLSTPPAAATDQGYRQPCSAPRGSTESDLCAQWHAAYAAEGSVYWAKWAFWVGLFGVAGLIGTIIQGRMGLREAMAANRIARDIGEAQTRAYVSIEKAWLKYEDPHFFVRLKFINAGQSPAADFSWYARISIVFRQNGAGSEGFSRSTPRIEVDDLAGRPIGAGISVDTGYYHVTSSRAEPGWLSDEERDMLISGAYTASIRVLIQYAWTDVFNKRHKSGLALFRPERINSLAPLEIEIDQMLQQS